VVAPCFIEEAGGATQLPQEVTIQYAAGKLRTHQVLQAVKFTDKRASGLHLDQTYNGALLVYSHAAKTCAES